MTSASSITAHPLVRHRRAPRQRLRRPGQAQAPPQVRRLGARWKYGDKAERPGQLVQRAARGAHRPHDLLPRRPDHQGGSSGLFESAPSAPSTGSWSPVSSPAPPPSERCGLKPEALPRRRRRVLPRARAVHPGQRRHRVHAPFMALRASRTPAGNSASTSASCVAMLQQHPSHQDRRPPPRPVRQTEPPRRVERSAVVRRTEQIQLNGLRGGGGGGGGDGRMIGSLSPTSAVRC